ncbi:MAG: PAS domain S-box protein [Cyanobacteria bacterium P01_D01_bin.115]
MSTKAPLRNAAGKVVGVLGLAQDISDLKAMEVSLRQSEQRFRDVTEAAGEYIWEMTPEGIYTFVTEQAKVVKGYGSDDLLGHTPFEFMPLDDVPRVAAIVETAAENKSVFQLEHQDVLPSGEVVWEAVSGIPILDDSGEITGFRGTGLSITDRKLAELKVAESEAKFRRLVEDANDMIYVVDAENRFTYLSPQFTKMWGYSIEACINQPFAPLVHPDDLPSVIASVEAVFSTGKRQTSIEFRTRRQDGTFFWVICSITPIKNDRGQVLGFQGVARDISDRKLADAAIAESEAKFRRLVENSNDLIYVIDADYCFTYLSPQFTEMWGYAVEEFMHQSFAPLIHPDDMPIAIDSIQALFGTGDRQTEIELRTFHKDGTLFWITCSNIPVKNDQGQVIGWQGTARDITERKAFEEAQSRLTAILDATTDFVGISNTDGEQLYMNPAGHRLLEIPPDLEIVGRPLDAHIPERAKTIVLEEGIPTAIREGSWQGETALLTHTGREVPVSQVIIAHQDADGDVEYLSTIVRDITVQKQAEVALQQKAEELEQTLGELQRTQLQMIQSEKMSSLGQLVAGVAHEINNPVGFIHGNIAPMTEYTHDLIDLVELYQQEYPTPNLAIQVRIDEIDWEFLKEDSPKILTSIQVGTERIRQIVGSLKNFSRLDEAECKEADIHAGIDSTLLILEHRIKATPERPAIQIEQDYGDLPLVNCYPGQLNQVFMNILANALDALDQRDRDRSLDAIKQHPSIIKVQTQRVGSDRVLIRIEDNGPGISEQLQQRIFDPFFTTKPVGKGTGIGMSISHQIITEKHGGTLQCFSVPGQGAQFVIEIPCLGRPSLL